VTEKQYNMALLSFYKLFSKICELNKTTTKRKIFRNLLKSQAHGQLYKFMLMKLSTNQNVGTLELVI